MRKYASRFLITALLLSTPAARSATAAELPAEHQVANGICGVIGDGKVSPWMVDLAKSGNVVVHVIAPSEKSADEIAKAADKAGVGGKLLVEPDVSIREGRLAIIADPSGAVFAIQELSEMTSGGGTQP